MALDDAVRDVVWERRGFSALGDSLVGSTSTTIHVDNQATIDLSKNLTSHDSTKHIDAKYYYVRTLIGDRAVQLQYIPTAENIADILTKPLSRESFLTHRKEMGIESPPEYASGSV